MINRVGVDIEKTRLILLGKNPANVYFETNEYIEEILNNFDVKNKKVLTVLSSGDQAFHFYNKGARKVDVFDKNPLTIYYYYLRRWVIIYLKKSYPDFNFNSNFLRDLLMNIIPSDGREKNALEYWTKFADLLDTLDIQSKYYFYDRVLLKKDDEFDCEKLSKILENDKFNFYNIDLSKRAKIPGKYDIIYTSNVSDYVKNTGTFNSYRFNLKHHLNRNGVIISSCVSGFGVLEEERNILEKDFNLHTLPEVYQPHILDSYSPGYYYTKKDFGGDLMSNVLYDVSKVVEMYNGQLSRQYIWGFNDYSKVYYSSNEDFKIMFSSIDMNDKTVLTVLASGDQALHFYNKGAKRVDVFDVNRVTKYYYGLRLLAIKYLNKSFLGNEEDFINNVIEIINKCSMDNEFEKEIVSFWSLLLKKIPKQDIFNTIFRGYDKYCDIENLKIKFNDDINFSFYNFDISDNVDECKNKYDILVLSNIHEYVSLNNMSIFTDNVSKLLQNNGYALITNFGPIQKSIREGLERSFLIEDLPVEYYCGVPVGNKLIKRRS